MVTKLKIANDDKRAVAKYLRHTKLVDVSRRLARIVKHVDPGQRAIALRTKKEKTLEGWLRYYLPEMYCYKWSKDHLMVLKKMETAIRTGGTFALAMPRGTGKSSIARGAVLFAMLVGLRQYPISISATEPDALAVIKFVKRQLMQNEKLHKHYPHITTYAQATEDKAIKARFQLRADGLRTYISWGKNEVQFPSVLSKTGKTYPGCGAILEARGVTGAIRGKWKEAEGGKVLRPDFVVIDDPQTRESAESDAQCGARERTITGDILGLAGPRKRIAAVMPCTIIREGDLASRFLNRKLHPEWTGEKCKMVYAWPKAQETLWEDYRKIYKEEIGEGRGFKKATKFYKKHKKEMDAGAKLAWSERVRDNEISALQTAENLLIEMHDQFYAEMQNDPVDISRTIYQITSKKVVDHFALIPRYVLPDDARTLVAFTDINRGGLHWVVASFSQDMTAHIPCYGRYPDSGDVWRENAPELDRKKALYSALVGLGKRIAGLPLTRQGKPVRVGTFMVDRGYEPETVHRFCMQAGLPFRLFASRGYAAHKYRVHKATLVGAPFENCHITETRLGQFMAHNADYWREVMQRAWLGDVGGPGGVTLFKDNSRAHMDFADHICSERLRQKYQTDSGLRWEWTSRPGSRNDWGDALVGCYVTAAAYGLTTSGVIVKARRRRETRKAK